MTWDLSRLDEIRESLPHYKRIFRFDDICVNTDLGFLEAVISTIRGRFASDADTQIMLAISPLVHNINAPADAQRDVTEQVFPKILTAHSDFRDFYRVNKCGVPDLSYIQRERPSDVLTATHGLFHVDHRLLSYEAQEMSILGSASLVDSDIFVPPFNKWNEDTDAICSQHDIALVKFEDGWLSMEHNPLNLKHDRWYLHHRKFTLESLNEWLYAHDPSA